jgi:putative transposase
MEVLRGYVYDLFPTPEQEMLLSRTVGVVRLVYNLALEQRRTFGGRRPDGAYRNFGAKGLSAELSALRRDFDWIGSVSQTAQNQALIDHDKAWSNFFAGRAGFPSPRRRGVNDAFRQAGREIEVRRLNAKWSEVKVPKIGWIRHRASRPLARNEKGEIEIRSATFRRSPAGRWQVAILLRCHVEDRPTPTGSVGADRGVVAACALSNGEITTLPETMARRERTIRRSRKNLSRKKRGSKRCHRERKRLATLQARNARARRHTAHVLSRRVAREFGLVVLEDLKIRNMMASARGTIEAPGRNVAQKAGLNRAIGNVGWHMLETMLIYKLEVAGGRLVKVPAAWSSLTCSGCGNRDRKNRESQAVFRCRSCGLCENADVNAARVILQWGHGLLAGLEPWRGSTSSQDVERPKPAEACDEDRATTASLVEASTRCGGSGLDAR